MDEVAPPKRIGEPRGELAEPVLGAIAGRERKKIARYLMAAKDMMAGGYWNDPVTGVRIPSSIKTDGVWVWSRPWVFFVEEHGAALPADFLAHVRALRYRPPRLSDERVMEIGVAEGVVPSAEFFAEVARVQAEYDAQVLDRDT